MTQPVPLSDERLAKIRADIRLANQGPPRRERFEAWTRAADSHAETLLDEVDRLRAALATAEGLAAGYGARIVAASMAAAPLPNPTEGVSR